MKETEMKALARTEQGEGDNVRCNWCMWTGLVPQWAENCPCCGQYGYLMDVEGVRRPHYGTLYVPIENENEDEER